LYALEGQKRVPTPTVRLELALVRHLSTVASWDLARDLSPHFPCRTLPKVGNSRNHRFSLGEAETVVRSTGSPVLENLLRCALETALRRREITQVRWPDIDLSKRTEALDDTKIKERDAPSPLAGGCQDP
jgi:integrase